MAVERWHFEKTVNVGHLVTTVVLVVSAFWFVSDMKQGINLNKQRLDYIESQRAEDTKRIEKRLDKIDEKLDRLIASSGG